MLLVGLRERLLMSWGSAMSNSFSRVSWVIGVFYSEDPELVAMD